MTARFTAKYIHKKTIKTENYSVGQKIATFLFLQ